MQLPATTACSTTFVREWGEQKGPNSTVEFLAHAANHVMDTQTGRSCSCVRFTALLMQISICRRMQRECSGQQSALRKLVQATSWVEAHTLKRRHAARE